MANSIKIDLAQTIKQLHDVALEKAHKVNKDIEVDNGIVTGAKDPYIKLLGKTELKKQDAKKFAVEYLKNFAGEDISKQIKDSDIEEGESKQVFNIKLDMKNSPAPSSDDDDSDDIGNVTTNSKKKKKFSIFSDLAAAGKAALKFARSIRIVTRHGGSYPVGKWLFGTTHDINDAKDKIKEQLDKEFPNNIVDYRILNSESVYNILVNKQKVIDAKEDVCKKLRESKYTFCAYVSENDPNYDSIDKDAFYHFFSKALHFKPSTIHLILDYNTTYKNKNKNAGDIDKKKLEKHNDITEKKIELSNKYSAQKKKIEKSGAKDASDQLQKLEDAIKSEYKSFLNKKYDEHLRKYEKSDDFDKDDDLSKFKSILTQELKDLEDRMSNGNSDAKDSAPDLYVIPMTSKSLFKKIRHSFDNSGESSDKGVSK